MKKAKYQQIKYIIVEGNIDETLDEVYLNSSISLPLFNQFAKINRMMF